MKSILFTSFVLLTSSYSHADYYDCLQRCQTIHGSGGSKYIACLSECRKTKTTASLLSTTGDVEELVLNCSELTDHGLYLDVTAVNNQDIHSTLYLSNLVNEDIVPMNVCRNSSSSNGVPLNLKSCNNVDWARRWAVEFYSDETEKPQLRLKAKVYYNEDLQAVLSCHKPNIR